MTTKIKPFNELSESGKWARLHPEYFQRPEVKKSANERTKSLYKSNEKYNVQTKIRAKKSYEKNLKGPEHFEERSRLHKDWRSKIKLRSLQIISGLEIPECDRCGGKDLRILEMEHINGGGCKERKVTDTYRLRLAIINGTRKTDDLKVLCKVCNIVDYVEKTFGINFSVKLEGENKS